VIVPLPIRTERLVLRSLADGDVQDIIDVVSHPSVARVTPELAPNELKVKEYIDKQKSHRGFEKDKYCDLGIERKADGKVIGLVGLMCTDHRQGLIGWGLGIHYRGAGYATEAARSLITYGFTELGLHRIYAKTSHANTASWKVMERLGMREEARFREAEFREGEWIDLLVYAVLDDEWQGGNAVAQGLE
jgi:aminoglycoside 6'-N-acetyltransferase